MKSQQVIAAVKQDRWSQVTGKHDDDPFMFRFREELGDVTDFIGYSCLLTITWTYTHDGCSGIPSQDELSELEDFENNLVELFEHDFQAVLAAVITERGTRQWLFYASDIPECQRRLDEMPQKAERYAPNGLPANVIYWHQIDGSSWIDWNLCGLNLRCVWSGSGTGTLTGSLNCAAATGMNYKIHSKIGGAAALHRWIATQRLLKKFGKLHPERERRLNAIGFAWDIPQQNIKKWNLERIC